ncbi:MAG: GAF domain-containing protein, partial [Deltaproteobacteria bacterium]|nr:GAF domain-containing protein [Deltaproteobacteria bacterium]
MVLKPEKFPEKDKPQPRIGHTQGANSETTTRSEAVRSIYTHLVSEIRQVYEQNEEAFKNIRQIRHRLIGIHTLAELVGVLVNDLKELNVDHVSLLLADDLEGIEVILSADLPQDIGRHLLLVDRKSLANVFQSLGGVAVHIGAKGEIDKLSLWADDILSGVLAPLEFRGRLIGCICLGAGSSQRFVADHSPDLLEDLAVTTAICLANTL